MKAERKETEFEPVVLTLDTKEEALFMWHLLSCAEGRSFLNYKQDHPSVDLSNDTHVNMWSTLDNVFTPSEK